MAHHILFPSHLPSLPRHPDHGKLYVKTKCPHCDFIPRNRSKYINHIAHVHEHLRPFLCPDCDSRFAIKGAVVRHHQSVHQGLKPFVCNFPGCGKKFAQKSSVNTHNNTVHLKIFKLKCHVCRKGFDNKNSLRGHMMKHTKEGHDIDECAICNKELQWTPNRGKRAKIENAPSTLAIRYPLKRNRRVDPRIPLYMVGEPAICSEEPDLVGTADQLRYLLPILVPKQHQHNKMDWDQSIVQFFGWKLGDTTLKSRKEKCVEKVRRPIRKKTAMKLQQSDFMTADHKILDHVVPKSNYSEKDPQVSLSKEDLEQWEIQDAEDDLISYISSEKEEFFECVSDEELDHGAESIAISLMSIRRRSV